MFAFSHEFNLMYIVLFSLFTINKHDDALLAEEMEFLCSAWLVSKEANYVK
jgi:hypothetical protein